MARAPYSDTATGPAEPALSPGLVTELIHSAQGGKLEDWNPVYAMLYAELREAARIQLLRHWRRGAPSPTSLISRAWMRFRQEGLALQDRQHLVAVLSRAMRYALLDEARRLHTVKRDEPVSPDTPESSSERDPVHDPDLEQLLDLDRALDALSALDARMGKLVEMRYFGGMSDLEIGDALGLTDRTIRREWRKARAFLKARLQEGPAAAA